MPAAVVVSVLAGYLGEKIVIANEKRFWTPEPGIPPHPPEYVREQMWNQIYNHMIGFGALGTILCGLIGLVVGAGISGTRSILGFALGSIVGLVVGAAVGVLGYFVTDTLVLTDLEGIVEAILIFAPVWIALGIVSCLVASGLTARKELFVKAVGISIGLGLAGSILYAFSASLVFPVQWPGKIIPEHYGTRLLAYVTGCVFVAISVLMTFRSPKKKSTAA